jgi:hypothetical protein
MGVNRITESWGTDGNHGLAQKVLWPYIRSDQYPNPPEMIVFKPSASYGRASGTNSITFTGDL